MHCTVSSLFFLVLYETTYMLQRGRIKEELRNTTDNVLRLRCKINLFHRFHEKNNAKGIDIGINLRKIKK